MMRQTVLGIFFNFLELQRFNYTRATLVRNNSPATTQVVTRVQSLQAEAQCG